MPDRVGQQLGNYHLVQLIGRGGFAEVYLGVHLTLGNQAAIKILHTHLSDTDEEQFRMEARTIAYLEHPHIIRILDFDVFEGMPFLVMNYAPNGNLRQHHPKGSQLSWSQILTYLHQIVEALQHAHNQKFIHRDIKPENVLLGKYGEVLLSDFGTVLFAQNSHQQSTQDIVGTAHYMAPEQFQGRPRLASDQYALGIMVYEWLCGHRPFYGSFTEVASQHVLFPPPSLCEQMPTLPRNIEQVVFKALAKAPEERFDSVSTFFYALEFAGRSPNAPLVTSPAGVGLVQAPLTPPPGSPLSSNQPEKPPHLARRKILIGVGSALGALALLGIVGEGWVLANKRQPSGSVATPTPIPSPIPSPSPTPTLEASTNLSYSTDLNHWNINYYRPSTLALSTKAPAANWVQPALQGIKRLFGTIRFGNNTTMNIILDQTTQLNSRGFFDAQAFFAYDADTDFSKKTPVIISSTSNASQSIEFTITYANGSQQKYAIEAYCYVDQGTYTLAYFRNVVRQGTLTLNGISYPIAVTDENNDGIYSDLNNIDVTFDLNSDGIYEDNEHFNASYRIPSKGFFYIIDSISEDGTQLTIKKL